MITKEYLKSVLPHSLQWGTAKISKKSYLDGQKDAPHSFEAGSAIVMLVPYGGQKTGELARYAQYFDYHEAVGGMLDELVERLKGDFEHANFKGYCDVSPFDEVGLAQKAGLGVRGKNSLLINSEFGSYFFICEIVTDEEVELTGAADECACDGCESCVHACPAFALENGLQKEKCLSFISQKRGGLTAIEEAALRVTRTVWGCDICQECCGANASKDIKPHEVLSFAPPLPNLREIERMSDEGFLKECGGRVFTYKGKEVIKRNISILENVKNNGNI